MVLRDQRYAQCRHMYQDQPDLSGHIEQSDAFVKTETVKSKMIETE